METKIENMGDNRNTGNAVSEAAFRQPHNVTHSTNVFSLLPKIEDIPKEFDGFHERNKWCKAASTWFFDGISKNAFTVKDGIDKDKSLRHLAAVLGSWDLKHEHKTAGAAYLMSLWFEDVSLK